MCNKETKESVIYCLAYYEYALFLFLRNLATQESIWFSKETPGKQRYVALVMRGSSCNYNTQYTRPHQSRTEIKSKPKFRKEIRTDHEYINCNDVKNVYRGLLSIFQHCYRSDLKCESEFQSPGFPYVLLASFFLIHSFSFGDFSFALLFFQEQCATFIGKEADERLSFFLNQERL